MCPVITATIAPRKGKMVHPVIPPIRLMIARVLVRATGCNGV
jgi:hypothetical protein